MKIRRFLHLARTAFARLSRVILMRIALGAAVTLYQVLLPWWMLRRITSGQGSGMTAAIALAVALGAGLLWLEHVAELCVRREAELADGDVRNLCAKKSMALPYASLQDTEILSMREQALFSVTGMGAFQSTFLYATAALTAFAQSISVVLFFARRHVLWVALVFLGAALSAALERYRASSLAAYAKRTAVSTRTKMLYLADAMQQTHQCDFRLFAMADLLGENIDRAQRVLFCEERKKIRMESAVQVAGTLLRMGLIGGALLWMLFQQPQEAGTAERMASLALFGGGAIALFGAMHALSSSWMQTRTSLSLLSPLFDFLDLPENSPPLGASSSRETAIAFRDVCFTYPHADAETLHGVSFSIEKGEKVTMVGRNMAGKTTIVQLLCGFFAPQSGEISIGGGCAERDTSCVPEALTAVFQDFSFFPVRIWENLFPYEAGAPSREREAQARELLRTVGLFEKIDRLPSGWDTPMEKALYPDGVNFSGGEAQRLAIVRAFLRNRDVLILDEPTAALDPIAEADIFRSVYALARDKTVLFISHRMSSCVFSDKVIVLERGRVVDIGPHAELMERCAIYRELFLAQAKYYRS